MLQLNSYEWDELYGWQKEKMQEETIKKPTASDLNQKESTLHFRSASNVRE